jgi:membrane protease YdiL (CAAX protease family)
MIISEKRRDIIQIIIISALVFFFFCTSFSYLSFTLIFIVLIRFVFRQTFKEAGFIWNRETTFFAVFCLFYLLIPVVMHIVKVKTLYDVWASPMNYIIPLANNLLLVGVLEELVFRGFIFNKMCKFIKDKRSLVFAVLISAGFFAFVHLPGMVMHFNGLQYFAEKLFVVLLVGAWTSMYYFYTKNLIICILVHGVHNTLVDFSPHGRLAYVIIWVFWAAAILLLVIKIKKNKNSATFSNHA